MEHIPSAIFETLCLARELKTPKGDPIAGLIDDVIGVALDDPDALLKFKTGRRGVPKRNFPPGIVIPRK